MKRPASKPNKNQWADHYTQKAQKENYPARSVYKLQEIQKKTDLIHRGDRVLDLGCAPGSWLLYAAELTGSHGEVIGVDLNPVTISLPAHAKAFTGDVFDMDEALQEAVGTDFDVVMSDMAPSTTGLKNVDAVRSAGLCEAALYLAEARLKPGGSFVCKIFQGPDFDSVLKQIRDRFRQYKIFKPQSSRKASREIFIIGLGKKQEENPDVRS